MYTIKQASIRSGVGVPLIRAWERRYGLLEPKRTASGYRMYDDEAIAVLVRVRMLIEAGWSASEASRAVLAGEVAPVAVSVASPIALVGTPPPGLGERLVQAAAWRDSADVRAVLDEMFALGSYEVVVDDLLMPSLGALGAAWAEGRLDIAAEHAASAAVHRRLSSLYEAAAVVESPRAVVGLPPGSRHELGALAFAVALKRSGVGVHYLGADVPTSSWVDVMAHPSHRVAVLGVVIDGDRPAALEVIRALRGANTGTVVAVGGAAAQWDAARDAGAVALPGPIREAARAVAELARGSTGPHRLDSP